MAETSYFQWLFRGNVNLSKHINFKEIGKTVFFTKAEPETALKAKGSYDAK